MPANQSKATIKIPRPLYNKLSQLVESSGYNSVTEFVVYVLRDIISVHGAGSEQPYSEQELEQVKEHLRRLGYL